MRHEKILQLLILAELALFLLGTAVEFGLEPHLITVLQALTAGVGGAILAVVYFSELGNRFRPLVHWPRAADPLGGRT